MAENQGILARELLQEAFNELQIRFNGKTINFPLSAGAETAHDPDWHRTRIGYSDYKSAVLIEVGGKQWVIAFGTTPGGYPADPRNYDIAAISLDIDGVPEDQVITKAYECLKDNYYFRHSLVYTIADGLLRTKKDQLSQRVVFEFLQTKIAKDLVIGRILIAPDSSRYSVWFGIRYKPEFVNFLADALQAGLEAH